MSIEETRALWEKFKTASLAGGADAASQLYAEDLSSPGLPFQGREAIRRFELAFPCGFPDYRGEFLEEVIEGDRVAYVLHYTATHTHDKQYSGPMVPATDEEEV